MNYYSLFNESSFSGQNVVAENAEIDNLDIDNINTNNLVVNGTVSIPNLTPSRIIQTNGSSSLIASNTLNNTTLSGTTNLSSLVANQLLRLDALKNIINDNTNYIDEDELYSTLVDYVTTTIFLETLLDYVTFTQLSIALADYVTYIQLTNTLADYLTLADFNNTLLSYYTANEVNILVNDYFFLSGNNTLTGNNTFTGTTLISGTNSTNKFQIKRNDGSNFLRASTTSYTTYLGCSLIPDTNASFTIGEPSFRMSSIYSTNLYLSTVLNVSGITGSRVIQTDSSSNFIGSNTLNNITLSGTTTTGLTASRLIQTNGSSQLTSSNDLPVACTSTNMNLTTPIINNPILSGTTTTGGDILINNANSFNKLRILDNSGNQIFNVNTVNGATTTRTLAPDVNNSRTIGTSTTGYSGIYINWISHLGGASWIQGDVASGNVGNGWGFSVSGTYRAFITSTGFQITTNNAYKASGTTWINPSDERLKQNIQDFTVGLETIDKIKCRQFEYKNDPGKKCVGVIAQEMLDVYPEAVTKDDKDMYMFDASDLIFILINSVKELKKENKILLNRIIEIENKMYEII